jgi:transmembrane sensor
MEKNELFNRLLQGNLSPEEVNSMVSLLAAGEQDPAMQELLQKHLRQEKGNIDPEIIQNLEDRLPSILAAQTPVAIVPFNKKSLFRYVAAASLLFAFAASWYFTQRKAIPDKPTLTAQRNITLPPGHHGAILTLDDNSTVLLDSINNGVIASQNGSDILLNKGRVTYTGNGLSTAAISYNTMTTPRGRQFQLTLPDSSKVWLDAASSIRFPTAFTGDSREVEITGEVYFEVAKDAGKPFRVKISNTDKQIEVLGTRFNINAYAQQELISTTLFEGSVKVNNGNESTIIKPGQQAQSGRENKVLTNVNLRKVLAWKDGVFDFTDLRLEDVMQQLERWYDIDVVYEKGIPPFEFVGKMSRELSLSEVLRGLEISEVHFEIKGRRLIVKP